MKSCFYLFVHNFFVTSLIEKKRLNFVENQLHLFSEYSESILKHNKQV